MSWRFERESKDAAVTAATLAWALVKKTDSALQQLATLVGDNSRISAFRMLASDACAISEVPEMGSPGEMARCRTHSAVFFLEEFFR